MLETVATCGLAFSGKSTLAGRIARARGWPLIALDAINAERGLDGGAGISVAQWEDTSRIAMARLDAALASGRSVVVDDTFSRRFLRDRLRGVAAAREARVTFLFLDTPLATIAARRAANAISPTRHAVEEGVFAEHLAGFERPDEDEGAVTLRGPGEVEAWLAGLAAGA